MENSIDPSLAEYAHNGGGLMANVKKHKNDVFSLPASRNKRSQREKPKGSYTLDNTTRK
ncbi:hypothetical protein HZA56_05565 [Candidatus Poribacteria bacterium]|nr:hypothetical protein [Candidatus Poribacteria bacterium]